MKRLVICLLALCLFLGALPMTVSAQQTDGYYRYQIMPDGTALLTGTTTPLSGEVYLPGTLGGHNLTAIGEDAFYGSETMISVTIPHGVTTVGEFAFAYCTALQQVTLPDTLVAIEQGAFHHCTALTEITLPASLTLLGIEALDSCYAVTAYHVKEGNTILTEQNGVLFNADGTALLHYPAGRTDTAYTIPNGVTTISQRAFNGSSHLQEIRLHNNLSFVEKEAFINCPSLTKVTLTSSVANVGEHAFGYTHKEGQEFVPVQGFTLQGLAESAAEDYATYHPDVTFIPLNAQQLDAILNPPPPVSPTLWEQILDFANQYKTWLILGGGVLLLLVITLLVAKKKKR